jgi:TM2 domain-containing membrane protein YozV
MLYSIVGADDKEYGPVDINVLVQWAREGRIVARTTVVEHGSGRRYLACDMAELAAVFSPAPNIAPPRVASPRPVVPPYAEGYPVPYDVRPRKSRLAAGLLGILLPGLGLHRFYLGYSGVGMVQLLMTICGWPFCFIPPIISAVWCFLEGILCLVGGMTDSEGRPLDI